MRWTTTMAACGLAGAMHGAAAAPANDDIAAATPFEADGGVLLTSAAGATASPDDPSCGATVYQSIWFRYDSPVDQFVSAGAENALAPAGQRPRMNAWFQTPGGLQAADCHPDGHAVGFQAEAGVTYYLQVHSPVPDALVGVNVRVNPNAFVNPFEPPAPANDLFWYAEPLGALPQVWTADVGAARSDPDYDPGVCGDPRRAFVLGDSLWYRWTAPADGPVDAMFDGGFPGPYVGVFTGSLDDLRFVACDDLGPSRDGAARFQAQAGTTYYIEFASSAEHLQSIPTGLRLRPTPPPAGGSIAAAPRVDLWREWVLVPELGFDRVTHLRVSLSAVCAVPVATMTATVTLRQGARVLRRERTMNCASGAASAVLDMKDADGFRPGLAQLEVQGFEFDTNYDVGSSTSALLVRVAAP